MNSKGWEKMNDKELSSRERNLTEELRKKLHTEKFIGYSVKDCREREPELMDEIMKIREELKRRENI